SGAGCCSVGVTLAEVGWSGAGLAVIVSAVSCLLPDARYARRDSATARRMVVVAGLLADNALLRSAGNEEGAMTASRTAYLDQAITSPCDLSRSDAD
ncbi:hypothetical protein ACFQ07_12595, partial [Actinomadura adrarensis]